MNNSESPNKALAEQYVSDTVLRLQKSFKFTAGVAVVILLAEITYFSILNNKIQINVDNTIHWWNKTLIFAKSEPKSMAIIGSNKYLTNLIWNSAHVFTGGIHTHSQAGTYR